MGKWKKYFKGLMGGDWELKGWESSGRRRSAQRGVEVRRGGGGKVGVGVLQQGMEG